MAIAEKAPGFSFTRLGARLGWTYWKSRDAALRGLYGLELVEANGRLYVTVESVERARVAIAAGHEVG
jgi:hypothetical protein